MDTTLEEQRIQALRQTIAELEQRKIELLVDLTTLEAAIAAMRHHIAAQHARAQKEPAE